MGELDAALAAQRRWSAHRREATGSGDVRIGVAASFTAQPLEPFVGAALLDAGVPADVVFAEYDQIYQVCWDPAAALGAVDFVIVLWRIEDMFGAALERAIAGEPQDLADAVAELGRTVAQAARTSGLSFVVSTPPFPRPIGVDLLDSTVSVRLARAHAVAGAAFLAAVGDAPVRWADLNAWQAAVGIERSHDVVKAMVYRQPYTTLFWHQMGEHLARIVLRQSRPAPKCVVLDCDNTLWGGVVGEEGVGGIDIGSAFPGSAFQGFQKVLKSLKERGVLLAIASKNNPAEVDDVFTQHDDLVLRKEDIAVWRGLGRERRSARW